MCLWRDGSSDRTSGPEGPGVPSGTSGEVNRMEFAEGLPVGNPRNRTRELPTFSSVIVGDDDGCRCDRTQASTQATCCRSRGTRSRSNQGLRRSHMLFRGLGCGSGTISGQECRHAVTRAVTEGPASGMWYAWAYSPTTSVSRTLFSCLRAFSRHATAHSGRGGRSPDLPAPGKQNPIGSIATRRAS
jgi:hypothetical protein